jgi:RHS repeat-associated protein
VQRLFFLSTLAVLLCLARLGAGQTNAGTPSFSAYDGGQYDTINLQNLNVSLNVPVMSKSGAFPFNASLTGGDSYFSYNGTSLQPGILAQPITPIVNGILSPFGYTQVLASTTSSVTCPSGDGTGSATKYSGWYLQMTDGTVHSLPSSDVAYGGTSCSSTLTDQVIDGTGWTVTIVGGTYNAGTQTGVTVVSSGGLTVDIATATIQDAQPTPNTINYGYPFQQEFIDTLGMEVLVVNPNAAGQLEWFDVNGGNPTESQTFTIPTLKTSFGCSGKADYPATVYDQGMTTAIGFPDGTSIGLAWEPNQVTSADYTGRLQKITLRGGGTITYNWNAAGATSAPYGLNCTYLVPNKATRTTSDGTVTYTTSFSTSAPYTETVTRVDQGGNKKVYTFTGFTSTGNAVAPTTQALTSIAYWPNQGSVSVPAYGSTATEILTYCYNGNATSCSTASVTLPVTEVDVYRNIGVTAGSSRQEVQYDGGPTGSCGTGSGGCYGNVTHTAQYDFGATSPARQAYMNYGTVSGPGGTCSAISATIHNKVCNINSYLANSDGSNNNTVSLSDYVYDSYGNLKTSYVSLNVWSTYLSNPTANTYNANGTPSALYDFAGKATTYSYSSGNYTGSPSNLPFATSVTKGGLTTYAWYNSTGGVKTKDEDASLNYTNYCYNTGSNCIGGTADPWWRILQVIDPLSNTAVKSYTATTLESSMEFNSNNSIQNIVTTLDGYGRTINAQKQQGVSASNYDTVSTYYNFTGVNPTTQSTVPCSQSLATQCGTTYGPTNTYDMLGRLLTSVQSGSNATLTNVYSENDVLSKLDPAPSGENHKQSQTQYDGLGRPTSTCELSANVTGNVGCNQNIATSPTNGRLTSITYSSGTGYQTVTSTRGAESRSVTVDGLGRVTQKVTPEGGTWNYYYDTAACTGGAAHAGKLTCVKDPNGNVVNYFYDSNNRLAETNANGSACRWFYYDNSTGYSGSIPSGITLSNQYGRLVEAATDACAPTKSASTLITDEWFNYDQDGNMLTMWEQTPNSTKYYESDATFTVNVPLSVKLVGEYTMIYGLDGEGRWNSLAKSGGPTVVSGTTYTPAGQPHVISIGSSTDNDTYTYDPNTGRMTNWSFEVGATPAYQTGALTWNPNGTLQKLAISDGFHSGGTQTCYYDSSVVTGTGYDDLGRLVGVGCGASSPWTGIWSQTFSYDQYDNLTKSGSGTFNPGYTSSPYTNQFSSSSGATYDSNGDITKDPLGNLFTWDPFGKMLSINASGTQCSTGGKCMIYDAFGRLVETDSNANDVEVWLTQVGRVAFMEGTGQQYALWPTPGGGTSQSTVSYLHKDWLGNARVGSTIVGQTVNWDQSYAPYGEIYANYGNPNFTCCGSESTFAGNTEDVFSGIYNTPSRMFSGGEQGRWFSPDPAGAGWNQYAYTTNPNSAVDRSGLRPLPYEPVPTDWDNAVYTDELLADRIFPGVPSTTVQPGGGTVGADGGTSNGGSSLCFCPNDVINPVVVGSTYDGLLAFENTMLAIAGWINEGLSYVANSGAGCGDGTLNCYAIPGLGGVSALGGLSALAGDVATTAGSAPTYVFWSGGDAAQAAATGWAQANGGITLEMTSWGQQAQAVEDVYGQFSPEANQAWISASESFANAASGNIQVFSSQPFTNVGNSVWFNYELPILANNPAVTGVTFQSGAVP